MHSMHGNDRITPVGGFPTFKLCLLNAISLSLGRCSAADSSARAAACLEHAQCCVPALGVCTACRLHAADDLA